MKDANLLPDPALSRVVLVGTAKYEHLPKLKSVQNNLGRLAGLFRDPEIWALPEENCAIVRNPRDPDQVITPIEEAAQAAADTLLVYYAGHGLVDRNGDLHLGLTTSVTGRRHTQLNYEWIRDPIHDSPARRRIVILDCCFSGRAVETTLASDAPYADQAGVDGSLVLTATPANKLAMAPENQEYTAFTHELIDVLNEGLQGADEFITFADVFRDVRTRLLAKSRPQPQARDRNNLMDQTGFRNRSFRIARSTPAAAAEERSAGSIAAAHRLRTVCLRASSDFLRRERHPAHERLYVERTIDAEIDSVLSALTPANLSRTMRPDKKRPGHQIRRATPPQVIVLSDAPGTGKTMLALQLSRQSSLCGAVLRGVGSVDGALPGERELRSILGELDSHDALATLLRARIPLVYVVDGLDRANHRDDQKQLVKLFDLLNDLNRQAHAVGLLAYPVALVFALRESEWDKWFTLLEGRSIVALRGAFPRFEGDVLDLALAKYESEFEFRLPPNLPDRLRKEFSLPINLRIASEALEYSGQVDQSEAMAESVFAGYIRRKGDEIIKLVPGLPFEAYRAALDSLASALVREPSATIPVLDANSILDQTLLSTNADSYQLLRSLIDERILARDHKGVRIAYPSILEYLLAEMGVRELADGSTATLETMTSMVASSRSVSATAVRSRVESLVDSSASRIQKLVGSHYATSATYVEARLLLLRYEIGTGAVTSDKDLASVYGAVDGMTPEGRWNAFFVVAAANNAQPPESILDVFGMVWDATADRMDRWKLLYKLRDRRLLYEEQVLTRVLVSPHPREWETLLGSLLEDGGRLPATVSLRERLREPMLHSIPEGLEWQQVRRLAAAMYGHPEDTDGDLF